MRKFILPTLIFAGFALTANAQQLTRFAVVDLSKVYVAFFKDSRAVRDFEDRSAKVQSEIDRMTAEIQTLKSNQVDAQAQGNQDQALRLETEINKRSDFLKNYYKTKTDELESIKSKLTQSGAF
ncbi:MAG: OmpH family outer membrane protein, partial [Treponema sp.]|nr:OmpH family outer membrane protein [Treponema sp.]